MIYKVVSGVDVSLAERHQSARRDVESRLRSDVEDRPRSVSRRLLGASPGGEKTCLEETCLQQNAIRAPANRKSDRENL